jgi:hypothetical protein
MLPSDYVCTLLVEAESTFALTDTVESGYRYHRIGVTGTLQDSDNGGGLSGIFLTGHSPYARVNGEVWYDDDYRVNRASISLQTVAGDQIGTLDIRLTYS